MSTIKGSGVTKRPIGAHISLAAIEQLDRLAEQAGTSRSGAIELLVIGAVIQLERGDTPIPRQREQSSLRLRFDAVAARFRDRSSELAAAGE